MFQEIFENLRKVSPIVHCITNYVTVNDVANAILAAGASPIMADAIEEMEDMSPICNALVLNIGTLNTRAVNSMIKAGEFANQFNHPVILDPVGVGASKFRMQTALSLIDKINFDVIRGNASEIKAISNQIMTSRGVDVNDTDIINQDSIEEYIKIAKDLSQTYQSVIVITGPIDVISDGEKTYLIRNGHEDMEKVSGTGCMLSGLIGAYAGANPDHILEASVIATASMGLSGQIARDQVEKMALGTSSLKIKIIDNISTLDWKNFEEGAKIESI